jgi:hypothetical protein
LLTPEARYLLVADSGPGYFDRFDLEIGAPEIDRGTLVSPWAAARRADRGKAGDGAGERIPESSRSFGPVEAL